MINLDQGERIMNENNISQKYAKKARRSKAVWTTVRCLLFFTILTILMIIGFFMSLRPRTSVIEKRKLAELPELTLEGVWDGSYFTELQTWYTDTYPAREMMINQGNVLENLYGLHKDEIHGTVVSQADEIPEDDMEEAAVIEAPVIDTTAENQSGEGAAAADGNSDADSSTAAEDVQIEEPEAGPDGTIHEEPESAGNVYITGDRAFKIYYFDKSNSDYYASMVNTLRARIPAGVNFYEMLAPTAFGVCLDADIQKSLGGSSEKDAIEYIYKKLNSEVKAVSVCDMLTKHNGEYLYFRTDHHWTALGAYYAYFVWCEEKGVTPHKLDEFEQMEFDGFLGSFYAASNKSSKLSNPDVITAYIPMGTNLLNFTMEDGNSYDWPIIYDVSEYDPGMKYSCFSGGDNPYTEIVNPKINDGSSCLLLKESYGNAYAPFLVDHYQYVYIVDYRYYRDNVVSLINDKKVQDVILLNNMEALSKNHVDELLSIFQ